MTEDQLFALTDEDREHLADGAPVIASLSGGKDSAAVALLLERNGIPFRTVFMDTGWEHPAVYAYLSDVLEPRFGTIERLKSEKYPGGMVDLVRSKGVFPSRTMRFCTEKLKWEPLKAFFDAFDDGAPVNVVGIRRGESKARSKMLRWEWDASLDAMVWRPLVDHSFDDVIAMHQIAQLEPNQLYLDGASRVGCFPCIFARKREVATVARLWPGRIDEIRALEAELTEAFRDTIRTDADARERLMIKARNRVAFNLTKAGHPEILWDAWKKTSLLAEHADRSAAVAAAVARGDHDDEVDAEADRMQNRTFFHGRSDADGFIDEIVEWARTSRGGQQFQLFDVTAQDGCMRWGLCDTADEADVIVIDEPRRPK